MMIELKLTDKEKIEIQIQKKQQIQRELIGLIMPHKGHTVFEINNETLEINEATYIKKDIIFGQENPKREILVTKGYSYVSALNKNNAIKQFNKGRNGSRRIIENPLSL